MLRRHDYLRGFSEYLTGELGRSDKTAEAYLYGLRSLERFTGKKVEKLGVDDLRRFKRESPHKPSSIQQAIVSLRQFHRWGAIEGYWSLNGIMAVPTPKVVHQQQPPLSAQTAVRLLEGAQNPNEKRVVFFGLYAGCRISESAKMTQRNVHGDRLIFIGKGNKQRTVPLHPELHKALREIMWVTPASEGVLHQSLARIRARLDAKDGWGRPVRSHALRRTFASTLYNSGVPYEVLRKMLGHGEDVTSFYAQIPYEKMAAAMEGLTYYAPGPVQMTLFE